MYFDIWHIFLFSFLHIFWAGKRNLQKQNKTQKQKKYMFYNNAKAISNILY